MHYWVYLVRRNDELAADISSTFYGACFKPRMGVFRRDDGVWMYKGWASDSPRKIGKTMQFAKVRELVDSDRSASLRTAYELFNNLD